MTRTGPGWLDRQRVRMKRALGVNTILCDRCKWNWRSACHRPERQSAAWCPDYQKKGG
jgi:hypothetical protein